MTFDLTPAQLALISQAASTTTLPSVALDAVLVVEEQSRNSAADEEAHTFLNDPSPARARLLAAASAVGIGRAAIEHAVAFMKANNITAGPDTTVPHWTVADGATEVEAARLLTYAAAQELDLGGQADSSIARALEFAVRAAQRAVDAAISVEGIAGYSKGGLLDRLARDARTLQVVLK